MGNYRTVIENALAGTITFSGELTRFYGFETAFMYDPVKKSFNWVGLDEEDSLMVAKTPKELCEALDSGNEHGFDLKKLEYSKVRGAYSKIASREGIRPLGRRDISALALIGGIVGGIISASHQQHELTALCTAIAGAGASKITPRTRGYVPKELEEFVRLREAARSADYFIMSLAMQNLLPK